MTKTNIEYLDYTWNPLAMRCSPVSEGCEHCWHLRMADRLACNLIFDKHTRRVYAGEADPYLIPSRIKDPLHLRKPARIGVQFMGDLFHDSIPFNAIHEIWDIMKACPQHTFIVLTKRPQRMKEALERIYSLERMGWSKGFWDHVWLGVSIENQARADERIPILLQIPAAKRWVSIEPMLGPVDLTRVRVENNYLINALTGAPLGYTRKDQDSRLDWIVLGGETGPGARPMHPDWVWSVRDQCQAAGVPFYFKQWGEWVPAKPDEYNSFIYPNQGYMSPISSMAPLPNPGTGYCYSPRSLEERGCAYVAKIGKNAAGHLLDGREWREMPGEQ